MKPAEFDYVRPTTISGAVDVLASEPDDARVLAGGQSLVPLMNFRLAAPGLLVDINRIDELNHIEQRDGGVAIGAIARQADAEASPIVRSACPLVADALHYVGHPQLRNRGTVVGSLAHHDPAAELPAVAVALNARMTLVGPAGQRLVDADEFFTSHFTTAAEADELLTEAWFPAQGSGVGSAFVEIARRPGDFAIVGVAAVLEVSDDTVTAARVAVSGMGARPIRCVAVEATVTGRPAVDESFARAATVVPDEARLSPSDDVHATASYRRSVMPVLIESALAKAAARAG